MEIFKFNNERTFNSTENDPHVQMHFSLNGINFGTSNRTGKVYKFNHNQHNMFYIPHRDMDYKVEGTQIFGIQFPESFLYRFVDENSKVFCSIIEAIRKGRNDVNT